MHLHSYYIHWKNVLRDLVDKGFLQVSWHPVTHQLALLQRRRDPCHQLSPCPGRVVGWVDDAARRVVCVLLDSGHARVQRRLPDVPRRRRAPRLHHPACHVLARHRGHVQPAAGGTLPPLSLLQAHPRVFIGCCVS